MTNSLPLKKRKRDGKQVTAWVETQDLKTLQDANVNVSELIRDAIRRAAESISKG